MRTWSFAAFGGVALILAASAFAASTADEAVLGRQAALKAIGRTFKQIHAIDAGQVDAQRTQLMADAAQLKTQASAPWSGFGPETEGTTLKNEALPVIWSDPTGFRAAQNRLINAAAALDAVAASGAPDVVEAKIGDVGAACGACHRAFRAK